MSIDEQPGVAVLSPRLRRASMALPEDPSEEELARDWTLSESERAEVRRCRGDDHRRRFAVQLCMLRPYGRFLEDYTRVPVKILNHLSRQLQLPPVLSLASPDRPATESAQQQASAPTSAISRSMKKCDLASKIIFGCRWRKACFLPSYSSMLKTSFVFGKSSCPHRLRWAAWRPPWARPAAREFSSALPHA